MPCTVLSPTNRSAATSETENCRLPDEICCSETAPASGQPLHPPLFCSVLPLAATFTCMLQLIEPLTGTGTFTTGDGVGVLSTGAGVGAGDGVGAGGGGVVGTGVGVPPSCPFGMWTMNASARPEDSFDVQMKYSPVTSRFPFGILL